MDITPDYEYIPEASKQTNTTVDSLDEFYLLTPDHVKLAYFIYFMIHSSTQSRFPLKPSESPR